VIARLVIHGIEEAGLTGRLRAISRPLSSMP
jgi:hypothetical protein